MNRVVGLASGTGDADDELHSLPVALGWALFALEDAIQAETARYVQQDVRTSLAGDISLHHDSKRV